MPVGALPTVVWPLGATAERCPDADVVHGSSCSTIIRRFAGPQANELAIVCRPDARAADPVRQAETAYRALAGLLASHQTSFRDLTCETLFVRDVQRELPLVLGARTRILAELGQSDCAPLPAFIQQAPVDEGVSFNLSAWAAIPRRRNSWSVRDVGAAPSCECGGCVRSGARLVHFGPAVSVCSAGSVPGSSWSDKLPGAQTWLYTTNVYGSGGNAFEEALDMFCAAERLLNQCGMEFRDVVRTWIYLRDIDRDYGALNKARREFFRRCGIERRPASTGVQGVPFSGGHDFSMRLHAVKSSRPLEVERMSTPFLNEAWSYGADFSRGLRLAEAGKVTLHVSGTASIDEMGRTLHVGNFEAQAGRMLDNIASLLAEQGATSADLVSGVAYLRNPADAPVLQSLFQRRGFEDFPCTFVEARLCRPQLLCEAEAVALLPSTAGA